MFKEQQMEKRFWHVVGFIGLAVWDNSRASVFRARVRRAIGWGVVVSVHTVGCRAVGALRCSAVRYLSLGRAQRGQEQRLQF
jgi:hypothetical protein